MKRVYELKLTIVCDTHYGPRDTEENNFKLVESLFKDYRRHSMISDVKVTDYQVLSQMTLI